MALAIVLLVVTLEGLLGNSSGYVDVIASSIIIDELMEALSSGGVEETTVGTVIVVSLNRTSAM